MLPKNVLIALLGAATVAEASVLSFDSPTKTLARRQRGGGRGGRGRGGNNNNNNNNNQNNQDQNQDQNQDGAAAQDDAAAGQDNGNNQQASETCLNADAIQTGSTLTGAEQGGVADGRVESDTDNANFINFCSGKTLTNGLQVTGGSCNGVVMGELPAQNRMVSTIITSPAVGEVVQADTTFDIELRIDNLQAGFFTEPQLTYFSAPQALNGNGQIIGHTHVTCQDLGATLNPNQPLDAAQFAFFKGINDPPNGQGILSATVEGGLPAGNFRCCTMAGTSNHAPVVMPVAQRGAQDDCIRIVVGDANQGNNQGNDQGADQGADQAGGQADQGNNQNQNQNQNQGNQGNNGGGRGRGGRGRGRGRFGGFNGNNGGDGGNQANDDADQSNQDNGNQDQAGADDNGNDNNQGGQGGAAAGSAIGGIAAPEVEDSGDDNRPFSVNGNTFVNRGAAVQRACDIQANACSDAANGGQLDGVSAGDCRNQVAQCVAELS